LPEKKYHSTVSFLTGLTEQRAKPATGKPDEVITYFERLPLVVKLF
jgi:hypothetical protein